MIAGDFNVPCVDWTISAASSEARARAEYMIVFVNFNGLYQLHTTINGAGNTCALPTYQQSFSRLLTALLSLLINDTPPFTLSIDLPVRTLASNRSLGYIYARGDYLRLYNHLRNVNWSVMSPCSDIDTAVTS